MKLSDKDQELVNTVEQRRDEIRKILKSKVQTQQEDTDMFCVCCDSGLYGEELEIKLLLWLKENPDSTSYEVVEYWKKICPMWDSGFDDTQNSN